MNLTLLDIQRVRNLSKVTMRPASGVNLVYGPNASGKTSLLEAIHILSNLRSFRTPKINTLIQNGCEKFQLFAEIAGQPRAKSRIGIERTRNETHLRIDQQTVKQASLLATRLPLQIINPEAHRLIEQGPGQRRKFLDWGLFHVEPKFLQIWQQYHRVLKQRNAALRSHARPKEIEIWNEPLLEQAEILNNYRMNYLKGLQPYLDEYVSALIPEAIRFSYYPGHSEGSALKSVLDNNAAKDRERGYTASGPHRADLQIACNEVNARDRLSRGQQKMLVCAMLLAQGAYLTNQIEKSPVILVDDLAAELDEAHRVKLLELLKQSGSQIFITVTEQSLVPVSDWSSRKMFHVEHGSVTEVV